MRFTKVEVEAKAEAKAPRVFDITVTHRFGLVKGLIPQKNLKNNQLI